jgi:cation transport regulator
MRYRRIEDLPTVQVATYDEGQKEAFLKAFNVAWDAHEQDEAAAFAAGHVAARRAGGLAGAELASALLDDDEAAGEPIPVEPLTERTMPYRTIEDLPPAQVQQYNEHQKQAFLKAFNNAFHEYHGDEHRAFAVAHHAAKQAGERPGPG